MKQLQFIPVVIVQTSLIGRISVQDLLAKEGLIEGKDFLLKDHLNPDSAPEHFCFDLPQLFITGTMWGSAKPLPDLLAAVRAANPKARCLLASGLPDRDLREVRSCFDGAVAKDNSDIGEITKQFLAGV